MVKSRTVDSRVKPWFSREIKGLINDRDEASERRKRYRTPEFRFLEIANVWLIMKSVNSMTRNFQLPCHHMGNGGKLGI